MKRRIAIFLLAVALLMTAACTGKSEADLPAVHTEPAPETQATQVSPQEDTPSFVPDYPGVYWRGWREEIAGTAIDMNSYIVLNEDNTGLWIAQDIGALTWEEDRLTLTVGAAYDIALTQEGGTDMLLVYELQNDQGAWIPTVFEKIEKLPTEISELLSDF